MSKSKAQKVIDYLEKGNSITKKECVTMFNYWNLSDIVYKLRLRYGHSYVKTVMKKTLFEAEYAEYSIPNPVKKQ